MMRLILTDAKRGVVWESGVVPIIAALAVALAVVSASATWLLRESPAVVGDAVLQRWQGLLTEQQQRLSSLDRSRHIQIEALMARLVELDGQVTRVEAIGADIVRTAKLPVDEFDFRVPVPVGGPSIDGPELQVTSVQLDEGLERLERTLVRRQRQLEIIANIVNQPRASSFALTGSARGTVPLLGSPLPSGWVSSPYGLRIDPFSRRLTDHRGVDLVAPKGSAVLSVAPGVVFFAGRQRGYGQIVEIQHADGITSRYAHLSELLAQVGDVVENGEQIGRVGSTGRATGPHLHFEVLKNGVQMDPSKRVSARR